MLQGQHRSLKEKLIRSKQDSNELREEVAGLYRLKDRQRTLELQLKVSHIHCMLVDMVDAFRAPWGKGSWQGGSAALP